MELYSKLHMRASVVDPICSSSHISSADLILSLGKAAMMKRYVPTKLTSSCNISIIDL